MWAGVAFMTVCALSCVSHHRPGLGCIGFSSPATSGDGTELKPILLTLAVKVCYGGPSMTPDGVTAPMQAQAVTAPRSDRRARRRQETIEEILGIAEEVMTQEGVNGLSLAEVARRLGVQPPSIYKY